MCVRERECVWQQLLKMRTGRDQSNQCTRAWSDLLTLFPIMDPGFFFSSISGPLYFDFIYLFFFPGWTGFPGEFILYPYACYLLTHFILYVSVAYSTACMHVAYTLHVVQYCMFINRANYVFLLPDWSSFIKPLINTSFVIDLNHEPNP